SVTKRTRSTVKPLPAVLLNDAVDRRRVIKGCPRGISRAQHEKGGKSMKSHVLGLAALAAIGLSGAAFAGQATHPSKPAGPIILSDSQLDKVTAGDNGQFPVGNGNHTACGNGNGTCDLPANHTNAAPNGTQNLPGRGRNTQ